MIHANLVEGDVFFGVAALTLLLMLFLYAVITADPEEATRTEAPLMHSAVLRRPRCRSGGHRRSRLPCSPPRPAGQAAPTMRPCLAPRRR